MAKLSIRALSLILASLFVALAFHPASAEPRHVMPRQSASGGCAYPDALALSYCSVANDRTIELAIRNSLARLNRNEPRAAIPTFVKGESYQAVRERLSKLNWKPATTADHDECLKGDGRCDRWPDEMQACSGTGEANCDFRWRKANTVIDVNTITDNPIVTSITKCRTYCR